MVGEPVSESQATETMNGVAGFVRLNSQARCPLQFTVSPVLRLPEPNLWYRERGWNQILAGDALRLAAASGFSPGKYDSVLVIAREIGEGGTAGPTPHHCLVFTNRFDLRTLLRRLPEIFDLPPTRAADRLESVPFDPAGGAAAIPDTGPFPTAWNSRFKAGLGWLRDKAVQRIEDFGTYTFVPFDLESADPYAALALEIPRDEKYAYWVEARRAEQDRPWLSHSLLIHEAPYRPDIGAELIDTTPGSEGGLWDAGLLPGRTYSDIAAGIHITSLQDDPQPFGDWRPSAPEPENPRPIRVMVRLGQFQNDRRPDVVLSPQFTTLEPGAPLKLHAQGNDPDGDTLAYSWDFGDATYAGSGPDVEKSWTSPGQYSVTCTVTDMKGGTGTTTATVAVVPAGTTASFYSISGQVSLNGGRAAGLDISVPGRSPVPVLADGSYRLSGLPAGSYFLAITRPGLTFSPQAFSNPVQLAHDRVGLNFAGRRDQAGIPAGPAKSLSAIFDTDCPANLSSSVAGDVVYNFVRGRDHAIWYRARKQSLWSNWRSLGGDMTSPPTAVSWSAGRVDIFARSGPHKLMHMSCTNDVWTDWESFPFDGPEQDAPGVCSWSPGRLDLFLRGMDNAVWHRYWAGYWSGWESLGGKIAAAPVAVSWEKGRIDVVATSGPGQIDHLFWWNAWSRWETLNAPTDLLPELSMSTWGPGRLDIWGRGDDGTLRHFWYERAWSNWESLGGLAAAVPSSFCTKPLNVTVIAPSCSGELQQKVYDVTWKDWELLN